MEPKIVVVNAALDERDGQIILRGVIHPDSLRHLKTDKYQREVLSDKRIKELEDAHRTGGVDDIELGMRGLRTRDDGSTFELLDPVYIIDGLQRVTAGIRVMQSDQPVIPHIGATIRFGTDPAIERKLFKVFNLNRTKLSSNIVLRNEKEDSPVMQALFRLTNDSSFVLQHRVQWGQAPKTRELISATTYVKVVGRLHAHLGSGRGSDVLAVAQGLDVIMQDIGRPTLVANTKAFFDLIDQSWGIRDIEFREGATVLKATFLTSLARVISDHEDFWTVDDKLQIPAPLAQKIRGFKVKDPMIAQLAGSSGTAADLLYDLIVKQINAGKRTKQLRRRGRVRGTMPQLAEES